MKVVVKITFFVFFSQNCFVYQSNNENYKNRLPGWQQDDIIILQYDTDLSILSFSKENDSGKLDACIKYLPKNEMFYWFVGHSFGRMRLVVEGVAFNLNLLP